MGGINIDETMGQENSSYYDDPSKYEKGTLDEEYYCEIWIPIKKK